MKPWLWSLMFFRILCTLPPCFKLHWKGVPGWGRCWDIQKLGHIIDYSRGSIVVLRYLHMYVSEPRSSTKIFKLHTCEPSGIKVQDMVHIWLISNHNLQSHVPNIDMRHADVYCCLLWGVFKTTKRPYLKYLSCCMIYELQSNTWPPSQSHDFAHQRKPSFPECFQSIERGLHRSEMQIWFLRDSDWCYPLCSAATATHLRRSSLPRRLGVMQKSLGGTSQIHDNFFQMNKYGGDALEESKTIIEVET